MFDVFKYDASNLIKIVKKLTERLYYKNLCKLTKHPFVIDRFCFKT